MTIANHTVEGILDQSRKIEFRKTVIVWVASIFYAIGWVVAKVFKVLWSICTFVWVAMVVGFKEGRGANGHPG